jgi:hypothetical protein
MRIVKFWSFAFDGGHTAEQERGAHQFPFGNLAFKRLVCTSTKSKIGIKAAEQYYSEASYRNYGIHHGQKARPDLLGVFPHSHPCGAMYEQTSLDDKIQH